MSPPFQTVIAVVIVALAAGWLIARAVRKRDQPGCGHDCGCPSTELKAKVKR